MLEVSRDAAALSEEQLVSFAAEQSGMNIALSVQ
jgi:hypothetical protein